LFIGGGRVFGPRPRDYSFKLNKKLKNLARLSALTYKAQQNNISIVEDFTMDQVKTKAYAEIMKSLNLNDKKVLLVLPQNDKNIYLSSRNIEKNKVTTAADINTYDVLNATSLVMMVSAVPVLENTLLKK